MNKCMNQSHAPLCCTPCFIHSRKSCTWQYGDMFLCYDLIVTLGCVICCFLFISGSLDATRVQCSLKLRDGLCGLENVIRASIEIKMAVLSELSLQDAASQNGKKHRGRWTKTKQLQRIIKTSHPHLMKTRCFHRANNILEDVAQPSGRKNSLFFPPRALSELNSVNTPTHQTVIITVTISQGYLYKCNHSGHSGVTGAFACWCCYYATDVMLLFVLNCTSH